MAPDDQHEPSERDRWLVKRLRQAREAERAPARLRWRIEAERRGARSHARRRAPYAAAIAGALAGLALMLVLELPTGTPTSPSVSQAAQLAARGPADPAPRPDPAASRKLAAELQHVYFPNWSAVFGMPATGQRRDRLEGRPAVTVFYRWRGRRVAYTLVGAPALAQPDAPVTRRDGLDLRTFRVDGRTVVTWRRAGLTCVLSAARVPAVALRHWAAWRAPGVNG
jgi:hypothetical protein